MMTIMSLKKGYQKGDYMEAKPACEPHMLILPVILKAVWRRYKSCSDTTSCISMCIVFCFYIEIIYFFKKTKKSH